MSTKADLIALIQSKLTLNGGLTTWTDHEEFLFGENSVVESFYPSPITETQAPSTITIAQAGIDYTVEIVKIGRLVKMTGSFENVSGTSLSNPVIFQIDPTSLDYTPNTTPIYTFITSLVSQGSSKRISLVTNGGEQFGIGLLSTGDLFLQTSIGSSESMVFEITYNTLN